MPDLRHQSRKLLTLGPITGVDNSTAPYRLAPGDVVDMTNFVPNRVIQSYVTAQGRVNALASNVPLIKILAIAKFYTANAPVYLVAGYTSATPAHLEVWSFALGGNPTKIFPTGAAIQVNKTFDRAAFIVYQNSIYFTYTTFGTFNGVKIEQFDLNLNPNLWQIFNPGLPPNIALNGAGNLQGFYYWRYTYSSATQESSPSPPSAQATLTGQQVTVTVANSGDPQVTTINIYRLGGQLSQWLLIGTIANGGAAVFNDNVADGTITGQTLVQHRDVPPGFTALEKYKERIWGFNSHGELSGGGYSGNIVNQSALWYSNYQEPWGWDAVNQVIPVGINPGVYESTPQGDVGIGLAAVGGVLVCSKVKSTWVVIGDDPTSFLLQPLFAIGRAGILSGAVGGGLYGWLSVQGAFTFDGVNAPNYISGDIKGSLDGMALSAKQQCVVFFRDQVFYFSFPTLGFTWAYYLTTQKWHKLGWATDCAYYEPENLQEVTAVEPNSGVVDSWFAVEVDTGNPITSTLTSRLEDSGLPEGVKDLDWLEILAPVQTGILTVTVQCNPGQSNAPPPGVFTVDLSLGPRFLQSFGPEQKGTLFQVSLSLTSSAKTQIDSLIIYGHLRRELVPVGQ